MTTTTPAFFHDQHYITALARLMDDRVLKDDRGTFAVFDQHGDINLASDEQGVFLDDTRYLSRLSFHLNDRTPMLLSSAVSEDNALLIIDMANMGAAMDQEGRDGGLPFGALHLQRTIFLADNCCRECATVCNYSGEDVNVELGYIFDADFRDIFEVRGEQRPSRGQRLAPDLQADRVQLRYRGMDDIVRVCTIQWSQQPDVCDATSALFNLRVPNKQTIKLCMCTHCGYEGAPEPIVPHDRALREAKVRSMRAYEAGTARLTTSNPSFNDWLNRSLADVNMMVSYVEGDEQYPFAGVPWYNTVFGRDGIITALQTLWIKPELARGVLRFLAATQATEVDPERDAEPGKIVHEMRKGEMARLGEVPFRRYYGTVDATPLFIMLAGRYFQGTGDIDTVRDIWPNLEAAFRWIDGVGDHNGDGFIDYQRSSEQGLANQGWKDSHDSIMHADGSPAEGPLALCEVQGYVYAARRLGALMAGSLGMRERAAELIERAERLKQRFDDRFWCRAINSYAIALDGRCRPCQVRASNPGHCLFTGIVQSHRARRIARTLMGPDMYTGWGIRTLTSHGVRYNPASYHNGSVWPHDNAIIAAGMSRCGFTGHAQQIMMGMFQASEWFDRRRLPELFCGFTRSEKIGPVSYPVACSPQAWASGAAFLMLRSVLGLLIDAPHRAITVTRPTLPAEIDEVTVEQLRVGDAELDLKFTRRRDAVDVTITRQQGDASLVLSR